MGDEPDCYAVTGGGVSWEAAGQGGSNLPGAKPLRLMTKSLFMGMSRGRRKGWGLLLWMMMKAEPSAGVEKLRACKEEEAGEGREDEEEEGKMSREGEGREEGGKGHGGRRSRSQRY